MAESKGVVKHILLAKFKDGVTQDQIHQLVRDFAELVNHIQPMKAFQWGKDVSNRDLHGGFTHVFETSFESTEGVAEYVRHPLHVKYSDLFFSHAEKVLIIDYEPQPIPHL